MRVYECPLQLVFHPILITLNVRSGLECTFEKHPHQRHHGADRRAQGRRSQTHEEPLFRYTLSSSCILLMAIFLPHGPILFPKPPTMLLISGCSTWPRTANANNFIKRRR